MFYVEKDNKIVLFDENKEKLQDTLAFMPDYQGLEIKETDRLIVDFEFADTEEYKEKQTENKKQARIDEIKKELIELDNKTIRPLRAGETEKLQELEDEAEKLREELQSLE